MTPELHDRFEHFAQRRCAHEPLELPLRRVRYALRPPRLVELRQVPDQLACPRLVPDVRAEVEEAQPHGDERLAPVAVHGGLVEAEHQREHHHAWPDVVVELLEPARAPQRAGGKCQNRCAVKQQ